MAAAGLPEAVKAVGAADFAAGVTDLFGPGISDRIADRSTLMAERRAAAAKRGEAGAADLTAWLIRRARWHLIDIPAWFAGYRQGLTRYDDEQRATAEGDDRVRRADAAPRDNVEDAVRTMIAALAGYRPAASSAGELSRALGATLLFARKAVVLQATRGEESFDLIGSAPAIGDAAPPPQDGAARAATWAGLAKSVGDRGDAKTVRSAMMATALLMDAPPAVAIGQVFGAMK